jgi:hypothetical protein
MTTRTFIFVVVAVAGCDSVPCGTGTIERDGTCAPASETRDPARCGPFTELHGDQCMPVFPPTECDPTTTTPDVDPATGVTRCIGTGGGGCSAPFACPTPTAGNKQTICGQLYDFETGMPLQGPNPTGAKCTTTTTTGPCSLQIQPYDAVAFSSDPENAVALPAAGIVIDDCGRYRLQDVETPSGPFIGIGIDDASAPGPSGTTVTVGVATQTAGGVATKDLEAWIVKLSTTMMWESSGGPPLAGGIYATVFRQHSIKSGLDPLAATAGVTFTRSGLSVPAQDHYFASTATALQTIDINATATGANGTALITGATIADLLAYSGTGGLSDTVNCQWETRAGASLPGLVFIQIFRPTNQFGKTCAL